jgi:hypothetical protein
LISTSGGNSFVAWLGKNGDTLESAQSKEIQMTSLSDATGPISPDDDNQFSDTITAAQIDARLRMESMSRVACALIFQSARDLVCAQRTTAKAQARAKAVREARQWIEEISVWAKTLHPMRYEGGGITLAGAVETINVHQDFRGGRRIDYWIVRELLLREPHRLAIVDGPAEFRTLTSEAAEPSAGNLNLEPSEDLMRVITEYEKETSRRAESLVSSIGAGEEGEKGPLLSRSP